MKRNKLKKVFQVVLIISGLISLYFIPWPIVWAWLPPIPDMVQEQVDCASSYGFDGIAVYVDMAGEPPSFYSSGYKNRQTKVPADPGTLFKIASVGKLYTALAVAKLSQTGQLDLDKTLAHYLPEVEGQIEHAGIISVRMMVQHRSGIPNYTDTHEYWAHPKRNDEERLALILGSPADFEPDTDFEYCNTNYLLLAELIERVTKKKKCEVFRELIFDPLNLKSTFCSINEVNMDDVMSGYYVGYDQDLKYDDNGSMIATAEDLGKFIRALNDGSAFTNSQEAEIYAALYRYEHTGLIPGYQTIAKYDPETDVVVIQFTNTVNFNGYNWNLSEIMYNRIVKILNRQK